MAKHLLYNVCIVLERSNLNAILELLVSAFATCEQGDVGVLVSLPRRTIVCSKSQENLTVLRHE